MPTGSLAHQYNLLEKPGASTVKIHRRQFLRNGTLLCVGLMCNVSFGDRDTKKLSSTIADDVQHNDFLHLSPSGEFFYFLSAACNI